MENLEKLLKRIAGSVSFKLAVVAVLTLLMLIPAAMIQNLIREREQRRDETIMEVTSKWGNSQTVSGPVLTIPFKTHVMTQEGTVTSLHTMHFLPSVLDISGTIIPEERYRGIYKVIAYKARLSYKGTFEAADMKAVAAEPADVVWDDAYLEIGIPDMRGINQVISVRWNERDIPVLPGIPMKDIHASGVNAQVPVSGNTTASFSFELDLNGSHSLNFIPLGKETRVFISSPWKDPSFMGSFLPDDHQITDTGFTAKWKILQLNRNYPQQWEDDKVEIQDSGFGVSLIIPVDNYQKSMRSVKYAILFVALTFLLFFFTEYIRKTKIHPVHYLLVGIALTVFYTLLTALSEHIPFSWAYLIASAVIVVMIALFTQSLYKNRKVSLTVSLSLTALYVFLFVILQMTDYALLFGSIGLVIVLAIVMYFSRKIDWYETGKSRNTESESIP